MPSDDFISDSRLWVELKGRQGRWQIHYNPHTHPGRFAVVDEDDNPIYVSKSDVVASSTEAEYWIKGFLRGAEPDADRMFGEDIWDADSEDPRWDRWREAVSEFRRTGQWRMQWDSGYEPPDDDID